MDIAGTIAVLVLWATLIIGILYGWVMNIINLIDGTVYEATTTIVVSVIGIFMAPVGALVHYVAG